MVSYQLLTYLPVGQRGELRPQRRPVAGESQVCIRQCDSLALVLPVNCVQTLFAYAA